jgi:hypothetical protein
MATDGGLLIVQLPRDGAVDRQLAASPPPSIASGRVVVEHVAAQGGRLPPPEAGEVVLSVLSPEALTREQHQVRAAVRRAGPDGEPLVILVEAAAELREDEIAVVLEAAARTHHPVIVRLMADG